MLGKKGERKRRRKEQLFGLDVCSVGRKLQMIGRALGLALYSLSLGLWIIGLVWLTVVSALFLLPSTVLVFTAGYTVNLLGRTAEWPALRYHALHSWIRDYYFKFEIAFQHPSAQEFLEGKGVGKHNQPAIWAVYPHGHFSLTHIFFFALNPAFNRLVPAAHSVLFYMPVLGSLMGWMGTTSVNESELRNTIHTQKSVLMCPGGIADSVNTGTVIKQRSGFLRVAHDTGAAVIPVWCPDERNYYLQWLPLGFTLQRWLLLPFPMLVWGENWCPLLPRRPRGNSRVLIGEPVVFRNSDGEQLLTLEQGEKQFWERIRTLQKT